MANLSFLLHQRRLKKLLVTSPVCTGGRGLYPVLTGTFVAGRAVLVDIFYALLKRAAHARVYVEALTNVLPRACGAIDVDAEKQRGKGQGQAGRGEGIKGPMGRAEKCVPVVESFFGIYWLAVPCGMLF